jgi:hypothetical protein
MKNLITGALIGAVVAVLVAGGVYSATSLLYLSGTAPVVGHMLTAADTTGGVQDGGVAVGAGAANTWTAANTFNANVFPPSPAAITATTANLDPTATAMCGGTIGYNNAAAGTLSILSTWPAGCNVAVVAVGAGLATIAAGTGIVHSACTTVRTRAQYSIIWIRQETSAAAGTVDVSGDCG